MDTAIHRFVDSEIALWGFDYVESLLDRGYEPTLITDEKGTKWVWVKAREEVTKSNRAFSTSTLAHTR